MPLEMTSKSLLYLFLITFSISSIAQNTIDSSQIYLRNAFILDIEKGEFKVGNILIINGVFQKIDYKVSGNPLEGVLNYDCKNKYIIPGLIDAHVHFGTDPSGVDNFNDTQAKLKRLLENGVTTVRDMAGDTRYLSYLSRLALLDEIPAPDIYYSALVAGDSFFKDPRTKQAAKGVKSGTAPWMRAVNSTSNIDQIIAEAKGTGATGIKIYANLEANVVNKVVQAAHKQGMKTWAHATVFPAKPSEISQVDVLSHATLLAWEGADDIPTNAFSRYKKDFEFDINNPVFEILMDTFYKNETILDATILVFDRRPNKTSYQQGIQLTRLAYQKNVKIGVGTDMSIDLSEPIIPLIKEMQVLQDEVGMKTIDILTAVTLVNAEMIGKRK